MSANGTENDDGNDQEQGKSTKLQKFLRIIDAQTVRAIQKYLAQHDNPSSQNSKSDKIRLYQDLLIIKMFKDNEKELKNKKMIDTLCQQLKSAINFSTATIRERIQKKLANVPKQQILDHIKIGANFSFNAKRKLIPIKSNKAARIKSESQEDLQLQSQGKQEDKPISIYSESSSDVQQIPPPTPRTPIAPMIFQDSTKPLTRQRYRLNAISKARQTRNRRSKLTSNQNINNNQEQPREIASKDSKLISGNKQMNAIVNQADKNANNENENEMQENINTGENNDAKIKTTKQNSVTSAPRIQDESKRKLMAILQDCLTLIKPVSRFTNAKTREASVNTTIVGLLAPLSNNYFRDKYAGLNGSNGTIIEQENQDSLGFEYNQNPISNENDNKMESQGEENNKKTVKKIPLKKSGEQGDGKATKRSKKPLQYSVPPLPQSGTDFTHFEHLLDKIKDQQTNQKLNFLSKKNISKISNKRILLYHQKGSYKFMTPEGCKNLSKFQKKMEDFINDKKAQMEQNTAKFKEKVVNKYNYICKRQKDEQQKQKIANENQEQRNEASQLMQQQLKDKHNQAKLQNIQQLKQKWMEKKKQKYKKIIKKIVLRKNLKCKLTENKLKRRSEQNKQQQMQQQSQKQHQEEEQIYEQQQQEQKQEKQEQLQNQQQQQQQESQEQQEQQKQKNNNYSSAYHDSEDSEKWKGYCSREDWKLAQSDPDKWGHLFWHQDQDTFLKQIINKYNTSISALAIHKPQLKKAQHNKNQMKQYQNSKQNEKQIQMECNLKQKQQQQQQQVEKQKQQVTRWLRVIKKYKQGVNILARMKYLHLRVDKHVMHELIGHIQ